MMEIHGTIHFGFLCWGADETCLRSRMNEINEKKEDNNHDERSSE